MYFYFTKRSRSHACYARGKIIVQRLKPAKPIFRVSQFPGKLRNIPFNRESRLLGVRNGVKKKEGEWEREKRRYYMALFCFFSFFLFLPPFPFRIFHATKTLIRRLDDERLTIGYVNLKITPKIKLKVIQDYAAFNFGTKLLPFNL